MHNAHRARIKASIPLRMEGRAKERPSTGRCLVPRCVPMKAEPSVLLMNGVAMSFD